MEKILIKEEYYTFTCKEKMCTKGKFTYDKGCYGIVLKLANPRLEYVVLNF